MNNSRIQFLAVHKSFLMYNNSNVVYTYKENKSKESFLYITASGHGVTLGYFQVCLLTIVLALLIIILNGLVIHTLLVKKNRSSVTDYSISSLSFADFITGVVLLYITTYSLLQYQIFWECLFRFGLTYMVSQSSFNHILAITIDRYVKIIAPLRYFSIFTKKTVLAIFGTTWLFSITVGLLPLLGWHKEMPANNTAVCRFFGVLPDSYFIFNFLTSMLMSFAMFGMYLHIIIIARRQRRLMKGFKHPHLTNMDVKAWNLVVTVAIVVLLSNICWLPGVILIGLHISGDLDHLDLDTRGVLITYTGLVVFLNSLINPLIYAAKIKEVKMRFCNVFCCKTRSQQFRIISSTEGRHLVSEQRQHTSL